MSEQLAQLLDLRLAWPRVKQDISRRPQRVFVRHPYELMVVEHDLEAWLNGLREKIRLGHYNPGPAGICEVPKGRGAVRPGALLRLEDRVVYAASVGACFQHIHNALRWSQGTVDFSYRLSTRPDEGEWLQNQFKGWQDFRERSLAKLTRRVNFVVMADISAYYENVDIGLLLSDLRAMGAPAEAVSQLSSCLNRWAQVASRGIPQGYTPSDILGKVYLNGIDEKLRQLGYVHLRYVDDVRVFCRTVIEAKRALIDMARLLRHRGLTLQSAKTEIHPAHLAAEKIEGVAPVIRNVAQEFVAEIVRAAGEGDPYMSVSAAEQVLTENPDDAPIEVIQEAYQTYFIDPPEAAKFDATLFRFLLKRLSRHGDKYAVDHCVTLFEQHPEETHTILDYLASVNAGTDVRDRIAKFMNSKGAVYAYQNYQLIEWAAESLGVVPERIIAIARRIAFDNREPAYLRAVCRKILGENGTPADLEQLANSYPQVGDPLEQMEIMCALRRMERSRRNAFLARAEGDGEINRRAAAFVRSTNA